MKTKYYFLAALASVMLASCSSDDFIAEGPTTAPEGVEGPIVFSSLKGNYTRADYQGKDAADLLGGKFVVSGYKGSQTAWNATDNNIVFDNYVVKYYENSANTTESNSNNWEYVGQDRIKHAIDKGITSQTIKYWDYSKDQYDFIAWSTGTKTAIYEEPGTGIPAGSVLVSAITPENATTTSQTAYTFKGKAADLEGCYIADLVTVKKADYKKPVTLKFRALGAKVRIGLYETIPGYSVKNVEFYSAAASNDAQAATPKLFTTTANDIYTEGVYTVYYPTVDDPADADNNQAHIKFAGTGTQSTVVEFGALNKVIAEEGEKTAGAEFLGRTSNTASYAGEAEGNYYTQYLPNEGGTNLNLRVNYTLEAIDGSGETIVVKGATAQVPSIYTQWKAGYAYTYLFKISDKTNGYTGVYDPTKPDDITTDSNPAGLYPITFDAVVVNAEEDATQETITTVSAPSITTYQEGSNVVNSNEYVAATGNIFVTVNDGQKDNTPDLDHSTVQKLTGKAALYTIPAGKTEAEVIDALSIQDDDATGTDIKGRNGIILKPATLKLTGRVNYGVDGNAIIVGADKVAWFTPTTDPTENPGKTYAFVYTKTVPTTTTEKFQPVTKAVDEDVEGLYRYNYVAAGTGDVQKGETYFAEETGNKVSHTAFLGQTVNNLYLDNTGSLASGYAVTGTEYYYTTDHGMTYTKAHNISYADFKTGTNVYTFDGTTYNPKGAGEPAANTAYYYSTDGTNHTYCVICPEQKENLFVLDVPAAEKGLDYTTSTNKVACAAGEKAIAGQVYFDKYTQNNGVYYAKVIKVQ